MSSTKTTGDNTVSHTIYFAQCHTCQLFAKVPFFWGGERGGEGGRGLRGSKQNPLSSVADPDSKDPCHFAGSGSKLL